MAGQGQPHSALKDRMTADCKALLAAHAKAFKCKPVSKTPVPLHARATLKVQQPDTSICDCNELQVAVVVEFIAAQDPGVCSRALVRVWLYDQVQIDYISLFSVGH